MTKKYAPGATHFLACKVKLSDVVIILDHDGKSDKCKAPSCTVLYECDVDGAKL